jgi:hypothetical protein
LQGKKWIEYRSETANLILYSGLPKAAQIDDNWRDYE